MTESADAAIVSSNVSISARPKSSSTGRSLLSGSVISERRSSSFSLKASDLRTAARRDWKSLKLRGKRRVS
jgi:hypothetical protein